MATAKKTRPVPDMGTLVPAMGIVPWREEKLEAIHKSVLLMLEHVHRLVTQKETLCELYMGEKQKAAALMQENARLHSLHTNLSAVVHALLYSPNNEIKAWESLRAMVPR